jgi:hypothetical protein
MARAKVKRVRRQAMENESGTQRAEARASPSARRGSSWDRSEV